VKGLGLKTDIISPFNSTIDRIQHKLGDEINEGDVIFSIVVNGVKMDILSPACGKIQTIEVGPKEGVISGIILGTIEE
jgi:biotin carboxyl carrier protein